MKWLKWIGVVLGVLVLILAAVPFFISLDDFIPTMEKEVSALLREPVKIGSLRAAGLPLPHVTVSGITIGRTGDIKVGKVTVTPDLWSLMDATKVIKSVEINGLVITQKAIDKITAWTQRAPGKPKELAGLPPVRVESIKLDGAVARLRQATFGPFDARLSLTADGNPDSASISTRDGKIKAFIKSDKSSYLIEASAKGWKPPLGPAIHFDELLIKGVATLKGANLGDIRAKLYGGSAAGKAIVSWEKGLQLKGHGEVHQVEVAPLLLVLWRPVGLSGKVTARPVSFSASATQPDQVANALRLETPFDVRNGILHGVDIKAASSLVSKDGGKGGETRFDALSGHMVLERGTCYLTQLNVVSGSLLVDGNVTISPKDELSGRVNTSLSSVTAVSLPLNVSGTVDSPQLLPTGGTMAGAAAGTVILGPVIGTTVGAKIGQWAEGLFGGKEEKKK